jgi:hypothetical protein
MTNLQPPAPNTAVRIELGGIPVRLWWKIMETAQRQGVPSGYFVFRTLAEAVGYNQGGEEYDLVLKEIKAHLDVDPA